MPALRELQRAFARELFERDTACAPFVRDDGIDANARIGIYRNNVFTNLRAALRAIYPVVARLVGEAFFDAAADVYIRRHPSRTGDVNDYGGEFAAFLAAFPPAASLHYLPDTARLEWQVQRVFHAADHAPLAVERLHSVDAARNSDLRFTLHPATALLESRYPVHRIWQVNQDGYEGDQTVDLSEGGVHLLIRRDAGFIELQPLSAGAWALLGAIADGRDFARACEAALDAEADFDLGAALQELIGSEVLVDFVLD